MTSLAHIQAVLGTDLYREMQRLEPVKGTFKGKLVKTLHNEFNRFLTIFKTGKFSTNAQLCTLLDKHVEKLNTLMEHTEKRMGGTNSPDALQQRLYLRRLIDETTDKILDLMHQTGARKGKNTKEFRKLEDNIRKLIETNKKASTNETKILHILQYRQNYPDIEFAAMVLSLLKHAVREEATETLGPVATYLQSLARLSDEELASLPQSQLLRHARNTCISIREAFYNVGKPLPRPLKKEIEILESKISDFKTGKKARPMS